ncbi:flagellar motor stator protein MotA [Amphiplicatus metriothermophilus]|uniref:Chemotaxis protein MotA n=1 Tax=Amphiplicatus metriothermophilus TaxID=1519374 RepID=A0A239PLB2_9PROT|nr:flagellar motor stator protein MotA [Amphiplicatus metriothermophilus]MBB5517314.1 chemotaxis protein MotA [Amphiplicatus metriothermophilus]SNT68350.1 chemotaxis protein MotA [Amphiplicatus metriothermophilus]
MGSIIGIAVTLAMVFGGYVIAGGKFSIIMHALPYELMIIGGAAVGAFLVGNGLDVIKHTAADVAKVFTGPRWSRQDFRDLLCLLFTLVRIAKESPVEIERHIENPEESPVFQRYPKIAKDPAAMEIICDTIRSMIMNFDNAHQVEELLEKQLEALHHHNLHGAHALQRMADGLPALGIVAAVLGVIKTMASIDKPPEVLGQMIGGALVGTFLGVFLAYGLVGPFADKVKAIRDEEHAFYNLIREALVASLHKHTPQICVEVARRNAPSRVRPSFAELEEALRETQKAA